VKRAVVVGGGEIGGGWAALFASHGVDVVVVDPDAGALARSRDALRAAQALGVGFGKPGALTLVHDLEPAVPGADWIQEAAPEALDLKQALLGSVERLASPEAVIASSTSSLTRADLSRAMHDRARLLIVHPLHPVYAVPVVEVSVADDLPRATVDRVLETLRALGRTPVLVKGDVPGLIANRLTAALLREALDLVARGVVTAADLDRVVAGGIALGWTARGPLATEVIGARLDAPDGLPVALDSTLAPLWRSLASWHALDAGARHAIARDLRESLGAMQEVHSADKTTWARTVARIARVAEKLERPDYPKTGE
jgi:3-hydroxyacyl-CoA dehydrogenase